MTEALVPLPTREAVQEAMDAIMEQGANEGFIPSTKRVLEYFGVAHTTFHTHFEDLNRAYQDRIAEFKAKVKTGEITLAPRGTVIETAGPDLDRLRSRITELEAERDRWKQRANFLQALISRHVSAVTASLAEMDRNATVTDDLVRHLSEQANREAIGRLVSSAVIFNGESILLLKNRFDDSLWELPGVVVDERETLDVALVNGLKEITGLHATAVTGYLGSFDYTSSLGTRVRQCVFLVEVAAPEPVTVTRHSGHQWASLDMPLPLRVELQRILDLDPPGTEDLGPLNQFRPAAGPRVEFELSARTLPAGCDRATAKR